MRAVFSVRPWHQPLVALLYFLSAAVSHGADKPVEPPPPLDVRSFDLAANQDQPMLCFTLSQTVARRPGMPLESFVRSDPEATLSAVPRNNRLCLTGFAFGAGYTVTLKSALPGVSSALPKDTQFRIQVPDRPPELDFAASAGDVLPRLGNDGLPVRSVNVPKIDIDLFRIAEADIIAARARPPLTGADIEAFSPARGEHLWHGTIEPKGDANHDAVTTVPVQQAIGTLKPGLYAASAHQAGAIVNPAETLPTQYFLVSDLGISVDRGFESLTVWVRSLSTGNAATGTDVALIGRNNRELARSHADDNGFVRFGGDALRGAGGESPTMVYAYGQSGDFAVLALDAKPGEGPSSATGLLLRLDRSSYQPGETADILVLLRTVQGIAISKLPLTVTVTKPNGAVFDRRTITDQSGGYDFTIPIPEIGSIGTWRIQAQATGNPDAAGQIAFDVRSNPLDRLTAGVSADAAVLDPTQPTNLTIQAQYPDGATAPNTPGELGMSVAAAAAPFPAFADYSFGLVDETIPPVTTAPVRFITDASGKTGLPATVTVPALTTKPLEAKITARLFDAGGRVVEHSMDIPVATQNLILGVRPAPGAVFADQTAHFEIIAVSPDGARQEKPGAGWEILQQESAPSWDWNGTRFVFRPVVRNVHVSGGMVNIPANAPAMLDTKLPPGRYQIEVFDPTGEAISSAHFMVGWAASGIGGASDSIELKPAKSNYRGGESAEIFVKPPYEADVAIVPVDPRTRDATVQHVPVAGATMRVAIPQDVGVGLRLLATAVAPADSATPNLTRRAFANVPLEADPAERQLGVKLDLPATAAPQTTQSISIGATGAGDEPVFVRIVATDLGEAEGEARDTGSPFAALVDGNAQSIAATDNYDRIITASGLSNGVLPAFGVGNDPGAGDAADPLRPRHNPLTLSSGIVALDKNGAGKVSLSIPDFSGKLKIVATAWSVSRTGQASATLSVHYPLTVALSVPPRLAPDDRADLTLALENVEGPRGEYHIKPRAAGGVILQDESELTVNLAEHEQRTLPIAILAKEPKPGTITLSVTGPGGVAFERTLAVNVVAPARITRHAQLSLKPGATAAIDPAMGESLQAESIRTFVTAGSGTDFELNGLASQLRQVDISSIDRILGEGALYLASADVRQNQGLLDDPKERLTVLVRTTGDYQASDGGFSRWVSGASDPWLSASVADFLTSAKSAGAMVPDAVMDQLLGYLARHVTSVTAGPIDQVKATPAALAEAAYAAKVLAANGKFTLPQLRYFSDQFQPVLHEPVAAALTAAAFAVLGDKTTATVQFARAMALPGDTGAVGAIASELDSQAILTALMTQSGAVAQPLIANAVAKLSATASGHRQFTVSEATWLFRAISPLPASEGAVKVKVGDQTLAEGHALSTAVNGIPALKNLGDKPLQVSLTVSGVSASGEIKDQGFELQRAFFDTSGKPVDPANVHQNDILVAVLTGRFTGQGEAHPVIVDPLSAGWDIEAAEIADPGNRYPWLKDLSGTAHAEADEGAYVAVPNLTGERHEFRVAYVVRAAARGQFSLPGATIQDIVQPSLWGRTPTSRTKVDPAP